MFPMLGLPGALPGFFKDLECTTFHIQTNRVCPTKWRWQTIRSKIIFVIEQGVDNIVNQRGVNHWTICRDADNYVRFCSLRGLIVTVKHVEETAARKWDSAEVAVFGHGVVRRISCRGENGFGNGSRARGPNKDALQHGLTCDIDKNFSWQTGRAHASLNDRYDTGRHYSLSSWGKSVRGSIFPTWAIWAFCSSNDFSRPPILLRWFRNSRLRLIEPGTITNMPMMTPRITASKMNNASEPSTSRPKNDIVTSTAFSSANITARMANASARIRVKITI